MLSPTPCTTAHLPPYETCPHNPLRDPSPPPGVSTNNFRLDRPKSLLFPSIVSKRWDLPRGRKRGKIPDAQFRRSVCCERVTGSTIARRRWQWGGPNPFGLQVASRNGTPQDPKRGVQYEDFPGSHRSLFYSQPSTLNYGVLMGSSALVLV